MQRNIVETVLGAVVLLVAGGFLVFFYRTTDIRPASGYEITAGFKQINGLQTGAEVRVGGIKVGQVLGFELDKDYHPIVHMSINSAVKLPRDTAAVVVSAGLMDGKFLSLEPGGDDEMLKPGDRIEVTQSSPGLEELLGKMIYSLNSKNGEKNEEQPSSPQRDEPVKEDAPPEQAPQESAP